jgi:hypothetical protein
MALGDGAITEVAKLEGAHNYIIWSFKVRNLLVRKNLWNVVSNSTLAIVEVDETATLEKERQKKKALLIINLVVRDHVVLYILDMKEPTVCSKRLKNLYATNNNVRRMLLRRKLTNLKMEEGTMMFTFLQSTQDLVNQLAKIGE